MENLLIGPGLIYGMESIFSRGGRKIMENIENMDRFSSNFCDVKFLHENRNEKQVIDSPKIGNLVKIVNRDFWIVVTHINYGFKTVMNTEYAGISKNNESENIILFNQEDILDIARDERIKY